MAKTETILQGCADRAQRSFPADAATAKPADAALYLAHTSEGESMRALARASGRHPSTVMRAVRRVEGRRDDPLFDELIEEVESAGAAEPGTDSPYEGDEDEVRRAAKRFLRRLSEPGAFLLVKPEAEKGGIFCAANQHQKPIAMMPRRMASEFLRRDWIRLGARGLASIRYQVTDAGRSALKRILAEEAAGRDPGFAEAQSPFQAQHREEGERVFVDPADGKPQRHRVNLGESPLGWLSRRRQPDGSPFLAPEEIEAGERLRQDFEAAQIGPSVAQDWRKFLTPSDGPGGVPRGGAEGPTDARERVTKALAALGPGLSDAALRVCCFLEGLEACERRMGWSARSGKVVLKIALQRLSEHYGLAVLRA